MKFKSIILAFIPFLLLGCNDLFDKGDVEKSYDGPPIVGFFPLQAEANLSDGSISIEVQLIAKEARSSDLPVAFHVNAEETTAVEGVHYTISTSSPVTLSAGSWTTQVTLDLIEGSLEPGEFVDLCLILDGGPDVPGEVTLNETDIRIQG